MYSPMTSAVFFSKSGSFETMQRSMRCGRSPCFLHTRVTVMWLTSRCSPRWRMLQCVVPSLGSPARCFESFRLKLRRQHRGHLAQVPAGQPREPLLLKVLAPTRDKAAGARYPFACLIPGMALGQQQDQPRAACILGACASARCSGFQLHTLHVRQMNGVVPGRRHTSL